MIVKAVFLFLAAMGVLAIFGKLRWPGQRKIGGKCPRCGRPRLGKGACPCGKDNS